MRKLNLGCGNDIRREDGIEWVNLDSSDEVKADIVEDFATTYPWPFQDGEFDEVVANNSLTQILNNDDFINVMHELWRVTKPNGVIKIRVPYALHECAWQDPMDSRRFTPESFTYMEAGHRRYEQYGKHYGFPPFHVKLVENNGIQMHFELIPCIVRPE